MIVICEECGKKYRIDPEKIKGDKARFKCRSCSHLITVDKQVKVGEAIVTPAPESTPSPTAEETSAGPPESPAAEVPKDESKTPAAPPTKARRTEKRKKNSGLGLTAKVILLMLIVSLIPGGIYFALSFKQANDRIFADNERFGKQIVDALARPVTPPVCT